MRMIALVLSLLVLLFLGSEFLANNNDGSIRESSIKMNDFDSPPVLSAEVLPVETHWLSLKNERTNALKQVGQSQTQDTSKALLSIGDQRYRLYGIFNERGIPFVLLKGDDTEFIKLKQGDVLNTNATLVEIDVDRIVFTTNDERIEYKLFERK